MVNFAVDSTMFNVEEKVILNQVAYDMSKEDFLSHCEFSKAVSGDEDMETVINGLSTKVSALSVEEWESLVSFLPFDVPFSDADINGEYEPFEDLE